MATHPDTGRKTLILIDGHALIYRAYHAFQDLTSPDGQPINAVYGFTRILLTVIKEIDPEYILVTFDHSKPTFRHAEYLGYKANREAMPDDLKSQIGKIKEIVTAFNMPVFELPGYEADDLIGTIARQVEERLEGDIPQIKTMIVTGDRDAFQLVSDRTHVWMPGRSKPVKSPDMEYDPEAVLKKMGVRPDQIVDLKALMGDASDNIPGVAGIGAKTAVKLLQEFDTLDNIYQTIQRENLSFETSKHPLLKGGLLKKLAEGHQDALMSQKLATIDQHTPVTLDVALCKLSSYKKDEVLKIFEELNFKSLINLLPADEFEMEVQGALF